jgi:hypothetical protein
VKKATLNKVAFFITLNETFCYILRISSMRYNDGYLEYFVLEMGKESPDPNGSLKTKEEEEEKKIEPIDDNNE